MSDQSPFCGEYNTRSADSVLHFSSNWLGAGMIGDHSHTGRLIDNETKGIFSFIQSTFLFCPLFVF
jgi:hypothetical protein